MLTIGEILQKKRLEKGLKLNDIEKKIKVREKYLQAIEKNDWNFFSSKVYIVGVLRQYARLLGLSEEKVLAIFRRDYEKKEDIRFKRRVASGYLTPETKRVISIGLAIFFIFIFIYFGFQLKNYFSPPKLILLAPKTENFKGEDKIKIVGKTEKDTMVTIFGERIYQNQEGIFEYQLPLYPGKNELVIELIGANGKKTTFRKNFYKSFK